MLNKRYQLKSHDPNKKIEVYALLELKEDSLKIEYEVCGNLSHYHFPQESQQKRTNELWRDTCFELFIANRSSTEYFEINLSPSTEWNAYHFKRYKEEMRESNIFSPPSIKTKQHDNRYCFSVEMAFQKSTFQREVVFNLALILLNKEGKRVFYALKRREVSPDFHDRDLYLLTFIPTSHY